MILPEKLCTSYLHLGVAGVVVLGERKGCPYTGVFSVKFNKCLSIILLGMKSYKILNHVYENPSFL
ncbi:hypothetical protein EZS27_023855 [termite gut metagenome]|uniref:Uncharacterized protein n=1 Tax=termite gut metagenome TaxID=433724 RepID=A0A5J4QZI5_9ZZZZ